MAYSRAEKKFYKPHKVLEAKNGVVTKIERGRDKAIIEVGMKTKSGGEILTLNWDTSASSDMYAEIGEIGVYTAVACIILENED